MCGNLQKLYRFFDSVREAVTDRKDLDSFSFKVIHSFKLSRRKILVVGLSEITNSVLLASGDKELLLSKRLKTTNKLEGCFDEL